MAIEFRPAVREDVGLIIGLMGGTGSGKTYSGMLLAQGITRALGHKRFAVIDTERGRAKHYADDFAFDYHELNPPFRPEAYTAAMIAADAAKYPVVLVDSASHEWNGEGGVLDWQEEELRRMGGGENVKMASWIQPKMGHKRMVNRMLQLGCHVILCFRAEPKIEMVKEGGRTKVVPKTTLTSRQGWIPVCEKNLPFELTVSLLMLADAPGVPVPIKLEGRHRPFFPEDSPITSDAGEQLAQWAAGKTSRTIVTPLQQALNDCDHAEVPRAKLVEKLGHEPTDADVPRIVDYLQRVLAARADKIAQQPAVGAEGGLAPHQAGF